MLKNKLG